MCFFLQRTSHFALADGTSFLMVFFCIERQKVQSVQSVQLFTICSRGTLQLYITLIEAAKYGQDSGKRIRDRRRDSSQRYIY